MIVALHLWTLISSIILQDAGLVLVSDLGSFKELLQEFILNSPQPVLKIRKMAHNQHWLPLLV